MASYQVGEAASRAEPALACPFALVGRAAWRSLAEAVVGQRVHQQIGPDTVLGMAQVDARRTQSLLGQEAAGQKQVERCSCVPALRVDARQVCRDARPFRPS